MSGNEGQASRRGNITSESQAENLSVSEGQAEDIVAPTPSNADFNFQQLLRSFKTTYQQMTNKTLIGVERCLETEIYNGVMKQVAGGFKEMNQVFLWVIDLNDPMIEHWFGDEVLQDIRDRVLPLPKAHPSVIKSISGFVRVSQSYCFLHSSPYPTIVYHGRSIPRSFGKYRLPIGRALQ